MSVVYQCVHTVAEDGNMVVELMTPEEIAQKATESAKTTHPDVTASDTHCSAVPMTVSVIATDDDNSENAGVISEQSADSVISLGLSEAPGEVAGSLFLLPIKTVGSQLPNVLHYTVHNMSSSCEDGGQMNSGTCMISVQMDNAVEPVQVQVPGNCVPRIEDIAVVPLPSDYKYLNEEDRDQVAMLQIHFGGLPEEMMTAESEMDGTRESGQCGGDTEPGVSLSQSAPLVNFAELGKGQGQVGFDNSVQYWTSQGGSLSKLNSAKMKTTAGKSPTDPERAEVIRGRIRRRADSYTCYVCGTEFKRRTLLQNHMRDSHDNLPAYKCEECGRCFRQAFNLEQHKITHGAVTPHVCMLCDKGFLLLSRLQLHVKTHTGEKPFLCQVCNRGFATKVSLTVHNRTHTGEKPFQCPQCHQSFRQKSTLNKHHQLKHTRIRPFKCESCPMSFISASVLAMHRRTHTGDTPFCCLQCGRFFGQMSTLKKHELVHSKSMPFACSLCEKKFKRKDNLTQHVREVHEPKLFECEECGKRFARADYLAKHQLHHTGERPHTCDDCHKTFVSQTGLTQHRLTHLPSKPFSCEECGKEFVRRINYTHHLRSHSGEKPFACTYCPKQFALSESLKQHLLIHTEKTSSYPCEKCDKTFSHRFRLLRHMKVHSDILPHKCGECDQAFRKKSNLTRHMKIHARNGQPPVICHYCGKKFASAFHLTMHVKIHEENSDKSPVAKKSPTMKSPSSAKKTVSKKSLAQQKSPVLKGLRVQLPKVKKVLQKVAAPKTTFVSQVDESPKDNAAYCCSHCIKTFPRKKMLLVHLKEHGITAGGTQVLTRGANDGNKGSPRKDCSDRSDNGQINESGIQAEVKKESDGPEKKNKAAFTTENLTDSIAERVFSLPFTCAFCEQRFAKSLALNRHVKRAHGTGVRLTKRVGLVPGNQKSH